MTASAHLWAVGYDDENRAAEMQLVMVSLTGPAHLLRLLDIAVLARSADGSLLLNGKPFPAADHPLAHGTLGLLAGFALAVPLLSDEAVGRLFDSTPPDVAKALGIDEEFKAQIGSMMRPGTSALLVLDVAENMSAILSRLRGLGGAILQTSVDIERAKLIQLTLAERPIAGNPKVSGSSA
jgi:uncharacterized membrane protein